MRNRQIANGIAVALCAVAAVAIMAYDRPAPPAHGTELAATTDLRFAALPDGTRGLVDATGRAVPLRNYQRIVGGSIVARSALGELAEPGRVVAVIAAGIERSPTAYRFAGLPRIKEMKRVEELLSLKADLVIVNSLGSLSHVQRIRDAGIEVFVLGDMRGVATFARDLRQVATLLGTPERGERLARGFLRRLRAVAMDVPERGRKTAMYLTVYGTQIFGGTAGTSYHDLLRYAGLVDAAAKRFRGWPQYTPEHVLSVDPEVIVVPKGVGQVLCKKAALQRLRACASDRAGVVELPAAWLEDPSMIMLDVVEAIREAVYGAP